MVTASAVPSRIDEIPMSYCCSGAWTAVSVTVFQQPARAAIALKPLNRVNVFGLQALGASLDLELDFGAFVQGAISLGHNRRKMHEHIVASRALNKSVPLGGVKPLYCTFFLHYNFSYFMFVVLISFTGKRR